MQRKRSHQVKARDRWVFDVGYFQVMNSLQPIEIVVQEWCLLFRHPLLFKIVNGPWLRPILVRLVAELGRGLKIGTLMTEPVAALFNIHLFDR